MNFKREFDKCSCGDRAWDIRETKFWQQIHNSWKEKEKYSKKNENSSKYVPVSALTKNTHESLFVCRSTGQARTKLYWCTRRGLLHSSHTLSVSCSRHANQVDLLSVSVQLTEHCRGSALSHKFRVQQQTRA